ncbi:hypothetical protein QBC45DRAFT_412915 [Copromyces sp. CBS 386.78]|nr:hypothetical protein QBC45DRAFT_412915 [Copromyces sp. CBS 386.78]
MQCRPRFAPVSLSGFAARMDQHIYVEILQCLAGVVVICIMPIPQTGRDVVVSGPSLYWNTTTLGYHLWVSVSFISINCCRCLLLFLLGEDLASFAYTYARH